MFTSFLKVHVSTGRGRFHLWFVKGQRQNKPRLVCAAFVWKCFVKAPREREGREGRAMLQMLTKLQLHGRIKKHLDTTSTFVIRVSEPAAATKVRLLNGFSLSLFSSFPLAMQL